MSFRRSITVLFVLALFAGLACAQIGGGTGSGNAFTCTTGSGAVTPQVRAEGYTELVGDIVLNCTGGQNIAAGQPIPQSNIVVSLNTAITSRLLPNSSNVPVIGALSEALLMIDEPGATNLTSVVTGYGPSAPQIICTTPLTGCAENVGAIGSVAVPVLPGVSTPPTTQAAPNVFQGVVQGNQVTFFGVPILPPATTGIARVYRITNIRGNATALSPGSSAGVSQVLASVSTNGSSTIPIANPTLIVGFVQTSLSASNSVLSTSPFQQCTSVTRVNASVLTFRELFGTAFKTRVTPLSNTAGAGQSTNNGAASTVVGGAAAGFQNIPGALGNSNSESGLIQPSVTGGGNTAGLADFGTRLKAVFTNVPAGVSIYVSVYNIPGVDSSTGLPTYAGSTAYPTYPPTNLGNQAIGPYAQLVSSESAPEGSFSSPTSSFTGVPSTVGGNTTIAVPISGGTGTAVWEVTNSSNAIDTLQFAVYVSFTASPSTNSPAPGAAAVALSYAPTPTQGAFTAAAGAVASSSLPIPRFQDTSTAATFTNFTICQTVLLWPFVTAQAGFDTGLAIANTSTDPFGTSPQAGTCTLNLYGGFSTGATPVTTYAVPSVASGTVWANNIQTIANGFQGYIIGVCNFQYAHGYGAVSDTGARNFVTSYLALVMNKGADITTRGAAAENLRQ